ncbi:Uncharacterised protein g6833 [Pycnogonum litorale]
MEVPGYIGYQLIGDTTVDFYQSVSSYMDKNIREFNSRVFVSRFLLKPTVFIGSNSGVADLLSGAGSSDVRLGYKDYLHSLFGDVLLFSDGPEAYKWRKIFQSMFCDNDCNRVKAVFRQSTYLCVQNLINSQGVNIYHHFKHAAIEMCLSTFLGLDLNESKEMSADLTKLITKHWHGIISAPVNVKIPLLVSSSYRKALDAKDRLLKIIDNRLQSSSNREDDESIFQQLLNDESLSRQDLCNHLLLFLSALIPKALSSILTSFILSRSLWEKHICEDGSISDEDLTCILTEIYRLWPPFIGGRRVAQRDTTVDGYKIPEGYGIIFVAYSAHRDERVFPNANEFKPSRWKITNKNDRDKIFTFGAGNRSCVGSSLVDVVIKDVCKSIMDLYTWEVGRQTTRDIMDPSAWKWLPVSRLKNIPVVKFESKSQQ